MKIRQIGSAGSDKVELMMTPMIDVVFQLLAFFMMSFKIIVQEGDFNIKMPIAAPSAGPIESTLPPIKVTMRANEAGELTVLQMGKLNLKSFEELHQQIRAGIPDDAGPVGAEGQEVELDCDYNLRYEYVIEAISAVSGYVKDGQIITLVSKIKFSPPKADPGAGL